MRQLRLYSILKDHDNVLCFGRRHIDCLSILLFSTLDTDSERDRADQDKRDRAAKMADVDMTGTDDVAATSGKGKAVAKASGAAASDAPKKRFEVKKVGYNGI